MLVTAPRHLIGVLCLVNYSETSLYVTLKRFLDPSPFIFFNLSPLTASPTINKNCDCAYVDHFHGDQWVRVTDIWPAIRHWTGDGAVGRLMCFHNVSAESSSVRDKGWKRCLVLCKELSRSQNGAQRRLKKSPAITALAVSRYGPASNPSHLPKSEHFQHLFL